jgi:hypothetical protein
MSERICTIQQETNSKLEEIDRHSNQLYAEMKNDLYSILRKLNEVTSPTMPTVTMVKNEATGPTMPKRTAMENEREGSEESEENAPSRGNNNWRHPFQMAIPKDSFTQTQTFEMSPCLPPTLNSVKHSIIVPPSSAAPAFYGKHAESPTQFLIRVQEYAESVHSWDRSTLVNGISQFLRDAALEWYCQLRLSHRRPQTWTEFTDLFLAQFNSPVRKHFKNKNGTNVSKKKMEPLMNF